METESTCFDQQTEVQELPIEAYKNIDDLLTVDCLLPGEIISIGMHQQYITPPRPAIVSAWQCKVNGGMYSKTRNLDGRTKALNVWKDCAARGDKIAQNYMGEIYGRSWGQLKPDYSQAIEWYTKSAKQGYNRAQNNLGFLYEHGFGVNKDNAQAQKLYQQAIGTIKPIQFDHAEKVEINELQSKLDKSKKKASTLKDQLNKNRIKVASQQIDLNKFKKYKEELLKDWRPNPNRSDLLPSTLQHQLEKLQSELKTVQNRENTLKKHLAETQQKLSQANTQLNKAETQIALKDIPNTGQYYALIIGVNNYQFPLADLKTPVNDAKHIATLLQEKYGFKTTLLVDDGDTKPTRANFYKAMHKLKKQIKPGDNFLIYFAGHGDLHSNRAHWLPQDAESEDDTNWLSTDDITKKIEFRSQRNALKARHVLIIADSCYSAAMATSWLQPMSDKMIASIPEGLITRSAQTALFSSQVISPALSSQALPLAKTSSTIEERIGWIRAQSMRYSRKELTSGGIEPVLDQATKNGLSVFANAFSDMLSKNTDIIGASEIYAKIGPQVVEQVKRMGMNQTPVYAPIPNTGDNHGEFFFIPR